MSHNILKKANLLLLCIINKRASHKFADKIRHFIDGGKHMGRGHKISNSEIPNFNEMVSIQSMLNPNRKPIKHLSSKI